MKIPSRLRERLFWFAVKTMRREPDVVIGPTANAYMLRWHVIPRNRFFNIYLHKFLRSDDDRALHDHPWWNCSVLIQGEYWEHLAAAGPMTMGMKVLRQEGHMYFRRPTAAHRVELLEVKFNTDCSPNLGGPGVISLPLSVITLFITGPKVREWGFLCPRGWVHHLIFTAVDEDGANIVGKGCE